MSFAYKSLLNQNSLSLDLADLTLYTDTGGLLYSDGTVVSVKTLSSQFAYVGDVLTLTGFGSLTTTNLTEGSNLYFTDARFNSAFAGKDTDDLKEGSLNLYYTDARARAAFSAGTGIGIAAGVISNTGVTSVTGTANQITVTGSTAVTLSTPQDIATTSNVQFGSVGLGVSPSYPLHTSSTNVYGAYLTSSNAFGSYVHYKKTSGTTRDWSLGATGTGSGAGDNCFALADDTAVKFRLIVNSAGSVGIGCSPTYLLDVANANASNNGHIRTGLWSSMSGEAAGYATFGTNFYMDYNATDGNQYRYTNAHGSIGYAGISCNGGNTYFVGASGATTAGAIFTPTYNMTILNGGKIGINHSGPGTKLAICTTVPNNTQPLGYNGSYTADGHTALYLSNDVYNGFSGAGDTYGKVGLQFGNWANYSSGGIFGYTSVGTGYSTGGITFDVRAATTDTLLTEAMRITSVGSVGIGTDAPGAKLDVQGGKLRLYSDNATGTSTIEFRRTSDGWNPASIYQSYPGSYGGNIEFQTHPLDSIMATAPTTKMMITGDGKVGIGMGATTPQAKLHVKATSTGWADGFAIEESSGGITNYITSASNYLWFGGASTAGGAGSTCMKIKYDRSAVVINGGTSENSTALLNLCGSSAKPVADIGFGVFGTDETQYHRLGVAVGAGAYQYYMSQNITWSSTNNRWEFINSGGWGGYGAMLDFYGNGNVQFRTAYNSGGLPVFRYPLTMTNDGECHFGGATNMPVNNFHNWHGSAGYADASHGTRIWKYNGDNCQYYDSGETGTSHVFRVNGAGVEALRTNATTTTAYGDVKTTYGRYLVGNKYFSDALYASMYLTAASFSLSTTYATIPMDGNGDYYGVYPDYANGKFLNGNNEYDGKYKLTLYFWGNTASSYDVYFRVNTGLYTTINERAISMTTTKQGVTYSAYIPSFIKNDYIRVQAKVGSGSGSILCTNLEVTIEKIGM